MIRWLAKTFTLSLLFIFSVLGVIQLSKGTWELAGRLFGDSGQDIFALVVIALLVTLLASIFKLLSLLENKDEG